jgi:ankyrin repeat protein
MPKESNVRKCGQALLLEALHDVAKKPSPVEDRPALSRLIRSMCENLEVDSDFRMHLKRLSRCSHRPLNFDCVKVIDNGRCHDEGLDDREVNEDSYNDNESRGKNSPAYFMLTESHLNATRGGRDALHNLQDIPLYDADKRDICGRIPLNYLAGTDAEETVVSKSLEYIGDLINTSDYHGYTPLHYACGFGSGQTGRLLLEHGAKLDSQGLDGLYPMHLAAYEGNEAAIDAILKWTTIQGPSSLTSTCRLRDYSNNLPIHWAVMNGHEGVMEMLEADIDMEGRFRRTPLFFAIQHDSRDLVRRVVELSEDLNKKDQDGTTALAYACSLGHWEDACILLEAGADPDISDRQGRNAVDAAVENSASPELIRRMRKDKS